MFDGAQSNPYAEERPPSSIHTGGLRYPPRQLSTAVLGALNEGTPGCHSRPLKATWLLYDTSVDCPAAGRRLTTIY